MLLSLMLMIFLPLSPLFFELPLRFAIAAFAFAIIAMFRFRFDAC